jgi:hypothetical protein
VGFLFWREKAHEPGRQENVKREDGSMADQAVEKKSTRSLSLDGWAVAIALLLAALIRLGVLKHVGW